MRTVLGCDEGTEAIVPDTCNAVHGAFIQRPRHQSFTPPGSKRHLTKKLVRSFAC